MISIASGYTSLYWGNGDLCLQACGNHPIDSPYRPTMERSAITTFVLNDDGSGIVTTYGFPALDFSKLSFDEITHLHIGNTLHIDVDLWETDHARRSYICPVIIFPDSLFRAWHRKLPVKYFFGNVQNQHVADVLKLPYLNRIVYSELPRQGSNLRPIA